MHFTASVRATPYSDKTGNTVPGIISLRSKGQHCIRCDYCMKFPNIVKRFMSKKPPAIASTNGTRFYDKIITEHLNTAYHKECANAYRISVVDVTVPAPMEIAISKANKQQMDYIGKLMIQIYLDAKRLNLSAHSWPARYVAGEASQVYDSHKQNEQIIADSIKLQYINTHGHLNLMNAIVQSNRSEFERKIKECLALSLRVDGSIDFTHLDKIYVMGKMVNLDGSRDLIFIGIGEQTERKAKGLMLTVAEASNVFVDQNLIFRKISSVCTDGTNVNTGETNSLWKLLDAEIKSSGSKIPLIKIWCAAHRAELAWKSVAASISEVNRILSVLSNISTYFHYSSLRSAELKKIALENGFKVLNIPKIFEIRWSQFTFTLLRNILVSWRALVFYFQKNEKNAECAGYLDYLTKLDNIKFIAFLADVLFTFRHFHKKLQSNQLTLIEMRTFVNSVLSSLQRMESIQLLEGFESKLDKKLVVELDECEMFLYTIKLKQESEHRLRRGSRSFPDLRNSVLVSLQHFLKERFQIDENLFGKIDPFINFSKDAKISEIHSMLAPDLSLPSLQLQFEDIANNPDIVEDQSLSEIISKLTKTEASREIFKDLIIVLARILACTPHSSDVERCISANNLLKTKLRSKLSIETENKYMYIHTNMPDLCEWNPTAAAKWFLDEKNRRNRDVTTTNVSSRRQTHFKGVFPEARLCADPESDDENNNDNDNNEKLFDF